ncbi:50S ribosomal protein L17 [Schaalia sp. 19OD2882]|uniref:50S ribosomal protein L17 n=1 Tax=Schaalia sp. 19OD2882 TaxID=2794089 RepID=UPI001C1E9AB8|nr:50S ribosomal protein L17 [Schaalia sp. 19OD2882]QWW19235.1 50S ribosomal protein L17 [Schaalia sp. 19OD2882]
MPTPKKGARLGGSPAHQKIILANLAAQLIEHRELVTTEAKAKMLQPYIEKLVTKAKRGDMHARRTFLKKVASKEAAYLLFEEIVPAMDPERQGGYTRLTRVGNRKGDNAPMMQIAFVMERVEKKAVVSSATKTAAAAAAAKKEEAKAAEETPAEETPAEQAETTEDK